MQDLPVRCQIASNRLLEDDRVLLQANLKHYANMRALPPGTYISHEPADQVHSTHCLPHRGLRWESLAFERSDLFTFSHLHASFRLHEDMETLLNLARFCAMSGNVCRQLEIAPLCLTEASAPFV